MSRVFQRSTKRFRLGIEKGEPGMGQVDGENEELRSLRINSTMEKKKKKILNVASLKLSEVFGSWERSLNFD